MSILRMGRPSLADFQIFLFPFLAQFVHPTFGLESNGVRSGMARHSAWVR